MKRFLAVGSWVVLLAMGALLVGSFADDKAKTDAKTKAKATSNDGEERPTRVEKTNKEWAKILTRGQYYVTREKGTEPAFSGVYANYHGKGTFACVCCGSELFDARTKFESGTGWPSFYKPIAPDRITKQQDFSEPEVRIEVNCSVCDAHLGHVFGDGPPPTGLRFCMNSVALKLVKPPAPATKAKASPKSKTTKARARPETGQTDGSAPK